ncbi:MAG TPA: single-stranded-DNA-specific exonuclease RecJ, partial [Xanthomonadales bacterium]|nr:single-stranded-DNA-specific exonuclease RecJ [Xanthomonadales bacterium]
MTAPRIVRRAACDGAALPADWHPVVRRVLGARGVKSATDADYRLQRLAAPDALSGLDAACARLAHAIAAGERIVVVGDYDADGATASAVAVRGLRLLGAKRVEFRVPHRVRHGYGLTPALVDELAALAPALLVTVDAGIASHAGVSRARHYGLDVVVTDHHLPGPTLPDAVAIVDPNLPGDAFPSKALAGVGVIFYVLVALRAHLRRTATFGAGAGPDLAPLLDLVALGTVADLVPMDRNNRVLVAAGLRRIRAGAACAGIRALFAVAGKDASRAFATDLGFAIAPRLNAAGRLEDMRVGIACLLEDDFTAALALAERLHLINAERRHVQDEMTAQADAAVDGWEKERAQSLPVGLCLYRDDWHVGVVGLVASRVKDRLHRPVVAFAPAGDGTDELKGSARSVPGLHLRDALADVATRHPGLIPKFGGHAMAAGLSLARSDLDAFGAAFDARVREALGDSPDAATLASDGPLDGHDATFELARALEDAGPWGQGFPEPLFDNEFAVVDWRVLGTKHLGLRLAYGCGHTVEAVHFGGYAGAPPPSRLHALY